MEHTYRIAYKELTDKQIVEKVLALPHNEEAAVFLLYNRYSLLLHKVYRNLTRETFWFDDCVDELFIHLKGEDCTWKTLASFEWRSTFGCWLKCVARHKFQEVLLRLIENGGKNTSLDDEVTIMHSIVDLDKNTPQIHDGGDEYYERQLRKIMLMEAIGQLKDDDQRFVILKRLEGYNSNEIAILLQMKWHALGIRKYNSKKEPVVPDAAYVDVRTQRAKAILRILIEEK